jgi:peptidoglycan/LPS O-acetylase OafA/YrhL
VAVLAYRFVLYWWLNWGHFVDPTTYSMDRIYYGTDTRIDTILAGCATALALREPALQTLFQRLREWPWFSFTASVAGLLAFGWATGGSFKGGWRAVTLGFTLMSITSAGVILAIFLQPHSLLSRVLSLSPIVFVGKLSYGVYLFHGPMVGALVRGLHWQTRALSGLEELIGFLATLIGSIVLAYAHYHVIEKRFLALRSRLDARPPALQMRQLSA